MKQDVVYVNLFDFFEGGNAGREEQSKWSLPRQREGHLTDAGRSRIERTEIVKFAWSEDSASGVHIC